MNNAINHELTSKTEKLIDMIFAEPHKPKAAEILKNECGNDLPFCESFTPKQLERIRFAALKTSRGSIDILQNAVNLTKADWRDLLVQADFANDVSSHDKWAKEMVESKRSQDEDFES